MDQTLGATSPKAAPKSQNVTPVISKTETVNFIFDADAVSFFDSVSRVRPSF